MLTEAQVKALRPQGDRGRYVADGGRSGLWLRIYPTGTKRWVLRTYTGGKVRERVLGEWPTVPAAEARRRAGIAPAPAVETLTFEAAARRWHTERILPRYRVSAPIVWRYIERDCADLLPKRLDTIRKAQIADVIERKKADGHNAAGKLSRILRKFFRWANTKELVTANPMTALDDDDLEIEKADPRDRKATDEELRRVWSMKEPHGSMIRFALLTACRVGEARGALPEQMKDGVWTHGPTKNGRMHNVPLTKTAAALLAKGWELRSPESLYQRMQRTVPGLKPHDLRRTAATRMRELGVSSDVIDAILNHTPPKLQRTYQLPDMLPAMRSALTQWEKELLRVVRRRK